jgi:hypothetical protein
MVKMLLQATEQWVEALARAATDLSVLASKRIQEETDDANQRAASSG